MPFIKKNNGPKSLDAKPVKIGPSFIDRVDAESRRREILKFPARECTRTAVVEDAILAALPEATKPSVRPKPLVKRKSRSTA